MHEWAAVNTWSRPLGNPGNGRFSVNIPVTPRTGNGRYSVNIPVSTSITPQFGLRRCKTTLFGPATVLDKQQVYKPKENYGGESSTQRYIRFLKVSNKESEAKLKNTMHMLRVQRSKSDLDARETPNSFSNMGVIGGIGGMMKERSHVFMPTSSEHLSRESLTGSQKQEMKVGLAVLNKKGLISLTTNDVSNQLPELTATVESRRPREEHHSGKQQSKSLIKRKDLMDHYKAGFKILADEEIQKNQEEELEKSLGDYTILDLQSKLLDFTDAKSPRRSAHVDSLITQAAQKKVPQQMKSEKSVTLPAIKTFNPF